MSENATVDADQSGSVRPCLSVRLAQPGNPALDVEFTCPAGKILALIGPSGSGKTTVLRCIAGLVRAHSGSVWFGAECWFDSARRINLPPRLRSIGVVSQNYALFPHMTARQNVMAALGHLTATERAQRADELLALVRVAGLEERKPAQLSSGQQQRVAVARALARNPGVLLLDEPFSSVDRSTRKKLYRELLKIYGTLKTTIVLVTHDLDEATLLADRLCLLHRGRTLQTGAAREVLTRPANSEGARLLDMHNVFEAVIIEHRLAENKTLIQWLDSVLEAHYQPIRKSGEKVYWMIPPAAVILHRVDRPSRGNRENALSGIVQEIAILGDFAHVFLQVGTRMDFTLLMTLSGHVAQRNNLHMGRTVTVSLLTTAIHLMPD